MTINRNFFTVPTSRFALDLDYPVYDVFASFAGSYSISLATWLDFFVVPGSSELTTEHLVFAEHFAMKLTIFQLTKLNQVTLTKFGLPIDIYLTKNTVY
jgi:hypothetical protein